MSLEMILVVSIIMPLNFPIGFKFDFPPLIVLITDIGDCNRA